MKLCTVAAIKGMTLEEFQGDICDRCGRADLCDECAMNAIEAFGEMARDLVGKEGEKDGDDQV